MLAFDAKTLLGVVCARKQVLADYCVNNKIDKRGTRETLLGRVINHLGRLDNSNDERPTNYAGPASLQTMNARHVCFLTLPICIQKRIFTDAITSNPSREDERQFYLRPEGEFSPSRKFAVLGMLGTVSSSFNRMVKPMIDDILTNGDIINQPRQLNLPYALALCRKHASLRVLKARINIPDWGILLALIQKCHLHSLNEMYLSLSTLPGSRFLFGEQEEPAKIINKLLAAHGIQPCMFSELMHDKDLSAHTTALFRMGGACLAGLRILEIRVEYGIANRRNNLLDPCALAVVASTCPNLESLTAPFSINDEYVAPILRMSSLTSLYSRTVNVIFKESIGTTEPDALHRLAAGLPSLASLRIQFKSLDGSFRIESTSLRSLHLTSAWSKDTPRVSLRCPALRELDIPYEANITGHGGECFARLAAGLERISGDMDSFQRDTAGIWIPALPRHRFCGCTECARRDDDDSG